MAKRTKTETRERKALNLSTQSAAFLLPIILLASFINTGPSSCNTQPPPLDFTISKNSAGVVADDVSHSGFVSADGTLVAFSSYAENLGHSTTRVDVPCVYVRDLVTDETTVVPFTGESRGAFEPVLSEDGGQFAFVELTALGTKLLRLRDVTSGDETVASLLESLYGDAYAEGPTISDTGRYVAFAAEYPLLADDMNGVSDIYLKDRQTDMTTRVSLFYGSEYLTAAIRPKLSQNGNWITFELEGSGVVLQQLGAPAPFALFDGSRPSINDDGSLTAYRGKFSSDNFESILVYDRLANTHERVSIHAWGHPSSDNCNYPVISVASERSRHWRAGLDLPSRGACGSLR
jgi:hypothetical protein